MERLSKVKLKWVKSLQLKKNRDLEGIFTLEGDKLIEDALQSVPHLFKTILVNSNSALQKDQFPDNCECYLLDNSEMERISNLKNPTTSFAILSKPSIKLGDLKGKILVLDGIQDPGNFGTIVRTAAWFNIKTILCSKETVDCFNPKVVQATMGALFYVEIHYLDLETVLKNYTGETYSALLDGLNFDQIHYAENSMLILGNEGNGISEEIKKMVQTGITIQKLGKGESLNVSIAGGILMSKWA